jgi:hypothetical protein
VKAVDESPEQYRKDASALSEAASASTGGVDGLCSLESLAQLKARGALYSRFVAIGLFRLLELAGAMEPAALGKLCEAAGVPLSKVNTDLQTYKSLLSKLAAAKELMAEFVQREQRKAAERAKEAAAAPPATA